MAGGATLARTEAIIHHDEGRTTLRGAFVKRRYYGAGYLLYEKIQNQVNTNKPVSIQDVRLEPYRGAT